jgi:surface protein
MKKSYIDYTLLFIVAVLFVVTLVLFFRKSGKDQLENFHPVVSNQNSIIFSLGNTQVEIDTENLLTNAFTTKKYLYHCLNLNNDICSPENGCTLDETNNICNNKTRIAIQEIPFTGSVNSKEEAKNDSTYADTTNIHFNLEVKIDYSPFISNDKYLYNLHITNLKNNFTLNTEIFDPDTKKITFSGNFNKADISDSTKLVTAYVMYVEHEYPINDEEFKTEYKNTQPISENKGIDDFNLTNWTNHESICNGKNFNLINIPGIYPNNCDSNDYKKYYGLGISGPYSISLSYDKIYDMAIFNSGLSESERCFLYLLKPEDNNNNIHILNFQTEDAVPNDNAFIKLNTSFLQSLNASDKENVSLTNEIQEIVKSKKKISLSELNDKDAYDNLFIFTNLLADNGSQLREVQISADDVYNYIYLSYENGSYYITNGNNDNTLEWSPGIIILSYNKYNLNTTDQTGMILHPKKTESIYPQKVENLMDSIYNKCDNNPENLFYEENEYGELVVTCKNDKKCPHGELSILTASCSEYEKICNQDNVHKCHKSKIENSNGVMCEYSYCVKPENIIPKGTTNSSLEYTPTLTSKSLQFQGVVVNKENYKKTIDGKTIYELPEGSMDIYEAIDKMGKTQASDDYLNINGYKINEWNTSLVTSMESLFKDIPLYSLTTKDFINSNKINEIDISDWDTSNVTNMCEMFFESQFNGNISQWQTHNVSDMSEMFKYSKFNGDISQWNTSNVIDMTQMFYGAVNFNQHILNWYVNKDLKSDGMFQNAIEFVKYYKPKDNSNFNGDGPVDKWIKKQIPLNTSKLVMDKNFQVNPSENVIPFNGKPSENVIPFNEKPSENVIPFNGKPGGTTKALEEFIGKYINNTPSGVDFSNGAPF